MVKEILFELPSPYRDPMKITGYRFGRGEKSVCIVGAMRGNEIQQQYICSQLVRTLQQFEKRGMLVKDNEILIIPSVNHYSMNIGKRFWAMDNSDINRMFPGYDRGETTQRIAAGLFDRVQDFRYGIQFASFYMPGDFIPHVRMMDTGHQSTSLANLFGLPYVVVRKPRPYDTGTLNYNWQIWNTDAFSVYAKETDQIDEESARMAIVSVLRFLSRMGIIKYHCHSGYIASIVQEEDMQSIQCPCAGIFRRLKQPSDEVSFGEEMAHIIHPLEGHILGHIYAPSDGIVFFAHSSPLINEQTTAFRIIRRLHG
ncbi:MAG: M14 family metallopeptidase [Butyricicoccus sp.]